MTTFRQKFVIALICFITSVFAVGQLNWVNTGEIPGIFWSVLTIKTLLPITIAAVVITGLLLWWNPDDGR